MNKLSKNVINFSFIVVLTMVFFISINAVEWWNKATNWYQGQNEVAAGVSSSMLSGIAETVEIIGTGVILVATVVIGIKYIFGTVQGKVEAKESLITLLVACIFFFGWTSIRGLLITGSATGENMTGNTGLIFFKGGDLTAAFAQVFNFLALIGKLLTVFAIAFMGVKYITSGADAKAQIKEKSPALIIGVILIFSATNVVSLIAKIVSNTLK
jgi:hypothetical protein